MSFTDIAQLIGVARFKGRSPRVGFIIDPAGEYALAFRFSPFGATYGCTKSPLSGSRIPMSFTDIAQVVGSMYLRGRVSECSSFRFKVEVTSSSSMSSVYPV
eukprot:CAMPEP_0117624434 /NCGR_PEP_ID=MMETSP0802-20121206/371_1 /TAXON_ID=38833 /ORGANISM="Micromonas sp., Strain CCMP2099" /LENGTH=101 /DNA_ID=CAMNT_0005428459 /DNA_START=895 /DNA_END=1200 /DNA_ORIENTATION=-